MKKGVALLFITCIVLYSLTGIVSAASTNRVSQQIGTMIETIVQSIEPVSSLIIGPIILEDAGTQYFFAKLLFLIMIISIVWVSLSRIDLFNAYPAVLWIVSISVGILGVRTLSGQWITTMLIPQQTLAVALAAGIPFFIYFIVVEIGFKDAPKFVRKAAWIFFAVIFTCMYFSIYSDYDFESAGSGASWVYPITALLCLIMIFLDGTFQRAWKKVQMDKAQTRTNQRLMDGYNMELIDLDEQLKHNKIGIAEYNKRVHAVRRQIVALTRV